MPYDYPGDYLMEFDGIDVGRFRELVVIPMNGQPMRDSAALAITGPGTVELHGLRGANSAGDLLLHRWQKSPLPTGTPPNIVIVAPGLSGSPLTKWLLCKPRPVKWVMKPLGMAQQSTGGNAVATETLTIAHEGFKRVK